MGVKVVGVISLLFIYLIITLALFPQSEQDQILISLDVKNVELIDVLKMIATQGELNIVTSKNVRGRVTIKLKDVPVEDALNAILKVNNCAFIKEGDIIQVYTYPELERLKKFAKKTTRIFTLRYAKASELKNLILNLKSPEGKIEVEPKTNSIIVTDTPEILEVIENTIQALDKEPITKIFRLNYADAGEIQKGLANVVPKTEGEILVDERTNSIVVTAPPVLIKKVERLILDWDRKLPQVTIETKIIEVTLDTDKFLGIDWKYQSPNHHSITVSAKDFPQPTEVTYVDFFKIGVLEADNYEFTLRALERTGKTKLVSNPSIVCISGEEASIHIGSSEPYEVLHYDEEGHVTSKETKFVDVGIKLTVTPTISEEGFITMKIHPEVSSARAGTVATEELAIDTTEATTVVTVKDGETVVLGGLTKEVSSSHIRKIPILGNIPFLGALFRTEYTQKDKKEMIIFLTPKILKSRREVLKETLERLERAR
jgi:type II secretory pathway component GspD/PulD (secretin)